jgi:2-polyprenyl-3-methyl-5-hydroxy-6-metoxy-1,4-benzoquinol methylase
MAAGGAEAYLAKNQAYYANARSDYIAALPKLHDARILEVGCGAGATGALALSLDKCATYCGIDICEPAAAIARERISEVLVGDVEKVELPWERESFDVLILSEVLEHLSDPWATLRRLRPLMKPAARVFASSPNVSHYSVISMLLRGHWELAEKGTMDRTHLRWMTPQSFCRMFEDCGYHVDKIGPLVAPGLKTRLACRLMGKRRWYLFARQIDLRAHCQ